MKTLYGVTSENDDCKRNSNKYLVLKQASDSINIQSYFINFNSFDDFTMNCNQTYFISSYINFLPTKKLIIDKSFN